MIEYAVLAILVYLSIEIVITFFKTLFGMIANIVDRCKRLL